MFRTVEQHGGRHIGPYELLEVIGEGGMANVYLGIKRSISNIRSFYAVKVIKPMHAQNDRFIKMFIDEAKVLTTIQHPNLVILHDIIEHDRDYAIVMEYLQGVDCRRLLKTQGKKAEGLGVHIAANIVAQACAGLHQAHQAMTYDGKPLNLVHRDISPHNLMVTFNGYVKVLDFGIAKSEIGSEETKTGILKGKIHYFSPEQCNPDLVIDRRTDVFALGIVFYELLTGQRPFRGHNELQIIQSILFADVVSPRKLRPEIPESVAQIVLKALSHEPDERFLSCDEMRSALIAVGREQGWDMSERALAAFMQTEHEQMRAHMESRLKDHVHAADISEQELLIPVEQTQEKTISLGPDCIAQFVSRDEFSGFVLNGQIKENMDFAPLMDHARGKVVLHLEQISRLTSFGIRHWLTQLPALLAKVEDVYLTRVSMPIVNQLVMIPSMMQGVKVISLMAPFRCASCTHSFTSEIFASDYNAGALESSTPCPECSSLTTIFDEDDSYLAPIVEGVTVSSKLMKFLEKLSQCRAEEQEQAPVEKRITEAGTEVYIHQGSPQLRWDRLLAGVDGKLLICFGASVEAKGGWLTPLSEAIEKLDRSCKVSIERLPVEDPDKISVWFDQLDGLSSAQIHSSCEHCGERSSRTWQLDADAQSASAKCQACQQVMVRSWGGVEEEVDTPGEAISTAALAKAPPQAKGEPQRFQAYLYAGVVLMLVLAIILVMVW